MFQQILRLDGHMQDIYMVVYSDKILLLDGCCRPDVPLVLDTIRHILGRDISELKAVIVTHIHADHAGGVPLFKKLTDCKIISIDKNPQWYSGVKGALYHKIDLSLSTLAAYKHGNKLANLNYPRFLFPDIVVNDGDTVPMFEDWRVIETAGHTDRDLSLYHAETGRIYVADLVVMLRHNKYVSPLNIMKPQKYIQSLARVKALKPTMLMMAHGGQGYVSDSQFDKLIAVAPHEIRNYKAIAQTFFGGAKRKKTS